MGRYGRNEKGKEQQGIPQLMPKSRDEIPLLRGGAWYLRERGDTKVLSCEVYLNAFSSEGMGDSTRRTHWRLSIVRKMEAKNGKVVPARGFEAHMGLFNGSEAVTPQVGFFRARCSSWCDAAEAVIAHAPILGVIRKLGRGYYGPEARELWVVVRPCRVVYPWRDPEEPNARYSPFKFLGATFDVEQDGAVVMSYGGAVNEAMAITQQWGGNAFLHGPIDSVEGPEYRLYHRDYGRSYDVVDIDDWRARVIDGASDL